MKLEETRAIITGGASGLGRAAAESIVAGGGAVTVFDVNEELGDSTVRELGERARFQKVDVSSETGVDAAVGEAAEAMGGLTLAVNCAGVGWP